MHELMGSKAKAIPEFTIDSEESTSSNEVESLPGASHEAVQDNSNTLKRKFDHNEVTGSTTKRPKNNKDRIIQTILKCHEEDKEERNNQLSKLS
ncbi:hypothetical protein QE152_g25514 [Popillia japonica]|uniref:Uncharacterized protein n=1 Tax=Popillia japonica TaxID=7064 RepID=A0AAW1K1F2_POPJA